MLRFAAGRLRPILVVERFGGGALELGWLQSPVGIGVVLGGITLGVWGSFRRRIVTSMLALAPDGIAVAAIGLAPADAFLLAVIAIFIVGFLETIVLGVNGAIFQATVPPETQGRVFAMLISIAQVAAPLGLVIAGPVSDALGVQIWCLLNFLKSAGVTGLGVTLAATGCRASAPGDSMSRGESMRITNIEPYPVWGGQRNFLFVVVDTDEGICGVGEAGMTGRELAVIGAIEHLKPLLIGQDPARIEHIWQTLFRGGFFPAQRIPSAAISAIDIALWDIKGKALGAPVYELLAVVYATGSSVTLTTGPVSTAACLQLNLACPNFGVQEQPVKPGTILADVVAVQPEWEDGYLLPPERPGLGIEFDREAAKRHSFRMSELPHSRRLDGSVTNW